VGGLAGPTYSPTFSYEKRFIMGSWALARLCLVRFGASLLVVLTTGVINRVFIGDLGYSELLVVFMLSLQHLVTPLTVVTGWWSDIAPIAGRHRTPHILLWCVASAAALVALVELLARGGAQPPLWLAVAASLAMLLFGLGVKASNLLVSALLVDRLAEHRRASALVLVWAVAILGLVVGGWWFTSARLTEPAYLVRVAWGASLTSLALAVVGVWGVEPTGGVRQSFRSAYRLRGALGALFANPHARRFFLFLALADFSFFCQDLILEVYGKDVFQLSVGQTTRYSLYYGCGTLIGMGLMWSLLGAAPEWSGGWELPAACGMGAASFALLCGSAIWQQATWVIAAMFLLGFAKGLYNASLSGAVMRLTDPRLAGTLLGLWGAISGLAIAAANFGGALLRQASEEAALSGGLAPADALRASYAAVYALEGLGLVVSIGLVMGFRLPAYRERLEHELREIFPAT
jgi:MFS transporter, BCD family, chlorophyll transporter